MQDFGDEKVKDEVLPEDEKEKFKVNINLIICLTWHSFAIVTSSPNFTAPFTGISKGEG